ncbi:MAG TPA: holo-[acyl-carrier-protein] synthase, partial [Idiomarina sp.]|nr:holo-[acyl-carrier-protein] synthase [Idiomarina sp.]
MAIFGMGTDMIAVARVETSLARGNGLVKRVLTEYEQDIWSQHRAPADYLAKRFAAKEACAKAFGTGIAQGLSFQHM